MKLLRASSCVLACLIASPLHAQLGAYITDPEPVNTTAGSDQMGFDAVQDLRPDVAGDGNGNWIVVWSAYDSALVFPSERDIFAARSSDFGENWTSPQLIYDNIPPAAGAPRLAAGGNGTWVVAWSGDNFTILASRSTNDGVSWSSPQVLDPAATVQRNPAVATDRQGNWVAVWDLNSSPSTLEEIIVARSENDGATWTAPGILSRTTPSNQDNAPHVAMSDAGTAIAAWHCVSCLGDANTDIYFSRGSYACDGDFCWADPQPLSPLSGADTTFDFNPSVTTDNQGNWVATWISHVGAGGGTDGTVVAAHSSDDGLTWSIPQPIIPNPLSPGYKIFPSVATDGQGNWVVAYDTLEDPQGNILFNLDLYVVRSRDNGASWSFPQVLNTNAPGDVIEGGDFTPRMAADGQGRFIAAWESYDSLDGAIGFPEDDHNPDADILGARFVLSDLDLVDPNPDLLDGDHLTNDPNVLAYFGEPVWGIAADGVTRALLRLEVAGPGSVQFNLTDENGMDTDVGTLSTPGGSQTSTGLPVTVEMLSTGSYAAFAELRAPPDFVRNPGDHPLDRRPINVEAQFFPQGGGQGTTQLREVQLVRPPVALLHGLWGAREKSWGEPGQGWPLKDDPIFEVYVHNYPGTHAEFFDVNIREARTAVDAALTQLRADGVAATQADVFGHSMGGLLSRLHAANENGDYVRDNNFGAGDIHKLITVNTPHLGSPWANFIDNYINGFPVIAIRERIQDELNSRDACIHCGAVGDLRTDSSETTSMPAATLPVHAMVGIGGPQMLDPQNRHGLPWRLGRIYELLTFVGVDIQDIFLPETLHDVVVSRNSQLGGLAPLSGQTSIFGFVSFASGNLGFHSSATQEPQTATRAVELLNTPVTDSSTFASEFPAYAPPPAPPSSALSPPSAQLSGTGELTITQPAPGTMVAPGATLDVTVTPGSGFVPVRVMIDSDHDGELVVSAPWTATLQVPDEANGTFTVSALAADASETYVIADEITVQVDVSAGLTAIRVATSPLFLFSFSPSRRLTVIGKYDDGFERDVTDASTGTTYLSQDPSVASVDAEGLVTAHQPGEVLITVENDNFYLPAYARVVVRSAPLNMIVDGQELQWPPTADASGYDVVRGDVVLLHSSRGDFSVAAEACFADDLQTTAADVSEDPSLGTGYWYLVRPVYADARGNGSYSVPGAADTSRDTGIAGSGVDCP